MVDSGQPRYQIMEDLFHAALDMELLQEMREELETKDSRQALQDATGIEDVAVLDQLREAGVTHESFVCIGMIPLIAVAWADKLMEPAEKEAVLKAAHSAGIDDGSSSYEVLSQWLSKKPGPELIESWKHYIAALQSSLSDTAMTQLKTKILERAEIVAKSAGGLLGLGNKVSSVEQEVLDDLSATFTGGE